MNYINRLQAEVANHAAAIERTREELDAFVAFLHSSKFVGVDSDGGRKDWISTSDLLNRLRELRGSLSVEVAQ